MNRTRNIRTSQRLLILAPVTALTAFTIAACGVTDPNGHSGMPGMSPAASTPAAPVNGHAMADIAFAQMMIAHHQQAVDMATYAESSAKDAELKALAAKIKAAQQPEIAHMAGWLTTWGQPTAQPGGHHMPGMAGMPGMMSDDEMRQLHAATGTDFDRMFARMMIAHHDGAIQMADDVLKNGTDAQVKALAEQVVTAQTAEVAQLQSILDRL